MTKAYLNRIATAVPANDVHDMFVGYASSLIDDDRIRTLFNRMVSRAQIDHRYSVIHPQPDAVRLDIDDFYRRGAFPDTAKRMRFYERHAFLLAQRALDDLGLAAIGDKVTHLIITSCTGFYAPGLDLQIIQHYGLNPSIERTIVGFMGCYAAFNALKLARHIVRSDSDAHVVILNIELCTLHLKEENDLEQLLSFLLFADGCAAGLVSAKSEGMELRRFHSLVMPDSEDQITWHIRNAGFDMILSGKVPSTIASGLPAQLGPILDEQPQRDIRHWAIHPGGRTIIDAVEKSLDLPEETMRASRDILRRFGNMSSASIMFVLKTLMQTETVAGQGCAMAFGPGVTVESMLFGLA